MKAKLKKILRREGGFTLTELAVAMLVVGILSAIAVPSFLGARQCGFSSAWVAGPSSIRPCCGLNHPRSNTARSSWGRDTTWAAMILPSGAPAR